MSKFLKKVNIILFGKTEDVIFENKIFNIITLIAALTNLLTLINNLFNNFPLILNIVLAVCCIIFSLFFYLSSFKKITKPLIIPFYIIVISLLSFTWFFNQGIEGSVTFYFFLVTFILIYINSHQKYWTILLLFIALACLLILLEFIFPQLLNFYPNKKSQLLDLITNFILILFLLGLSTIFLKKSFDKERSKVEHFAEEMKELNATKDKFFSIISHDLRNPFNSILGLSNMLLSNLNTYSKEEITEKIGLIAESSKRAHILLENLLEWSLSQTGKILFIPEKIKLSDVVNECLIEITNQASNKKIKIVNEINEGHIVKADKNMLKIILRNLLTNAVKYSYTGGVVIIKSIDRNFEIEISITDSGIGIEENDIDKLFHIDSKYSTNGTLNEQGTGLGLILCKEFIEKHGGRIWIDSKIEKGCTFKFTLPK